MSNLLDLSHHRSTPIKVSLEYQALLHRNIKKSKHAFSNRSVPEIPIVVSEMQFIFISQVTIDNVAGSANPIFKGLYNTVHKLFALRLP